MEFDRRFQSYTKGGSFSLESVVQPKGFHNLTMYYDPHNHNILANNPSDCSLTFDQSNNASLFSLNDVNSARNNLGTAIGSFDNNVEFYNNNQQNMEGINSQQTHRNDAYPQIYSFANQTELCTAFLPSNNFSNLVEEHNNSLFDHNVNINGDYIQIKEISANQANKKIVLKGQWTAEEDQILVHLVNNYGVENWSRIAQMLGFRIGKQCRERWYSHLRPGIKKGPWSEEEDMVLIRAHSQLGNKWSEISKLLPGRTENSIKNRWNANLRKQFPRTTNNAGRRRHRKSSGGLIQNYMQSLAHISPAPAIAKKKKTNRSRPPSSSNIMSGFSGADENVDSGIEDDVVQQFQQLSFDHGATTSSSNSGIEDWPGASSSNSGIDLGMDWPGAMPLLAMSENETMAMGLPEMTVLNDSFIF